MGTCMICGTSTEGHVCTSHEQDVCFEFEGSRPGQLTEGRFYRGTVDGFAEFGVFIDVGDHVTGLLHTSELDQRLESIDWDPGDSVYVQVKNVRDDGNVDLGWSIRQHESEFRGKLIDTPEGDERPEAEGESADPDAGGSGSSHGGTVETPSDSETASDSGDGPTETAESSQPSSDRTPGGGNEATTGGAAATGKLRSSSDADETGGASDSAEAASGQDLETGEDSDATVVETDLERSAVETLADLVGDPVALEGRIVEARQTSGPTVFELRDETGTVECAAFESAGVRAYPEIETGDVVRLVGVVEERRGDVQVETDSIEELTGEDRDTFEQRLEEAIEARAEPEDVDLLVTEPGAEAVRDETVAAATAIRRAIIESRPVVVRHSATVDGYAAGAAIERAALPLVRAEHDAADAAYHHINRRPLSDRIYGMRDAVRDVTNLLEAGERHDEAVPLFVFVNAGSTTESIDGFDLLSTYDADRIVIEGDYPDAEMAGEASVFVSPHLAGSSDAESSSTTAIAANVAALVTADVRDDLRHLSAVSYWRDCPDSLQDLADQAGYDEDRLETVREAIALQAFYQTYDDKRELIEDLLFGEQALAEHASEQFRDKIENELRTAGPHLKKHPANGETVGVLDVDAFTNTYEFPPTEVLLARLADREDVPVVLGLDEDRLYSWSETVIDMREVGKRVADAVPNGGVETRGGRDGRLVFLRGERDAVREAAIEAVADQLA